MRTSKLFGAVAIAAAASFVSTASADDLVIVDLSTPDTVIVTATDGLSAIDASGPDGIGILLADFYLAPTVDAIFSSSGVGDFTNAENPSDGTPGLFSSTDQSGLNVWTFSSDDTVTFTADSLAFVGTATYSISSTEYAELLGGPTSGDLYFPADTDDDIAGLTPLGTWTTVIPEPASLSLLGMAGLGLVRRRRA